MLSFAVLVLDEVMQQMDVDGQAAMARVLKGIGAETTIVVAHGLASDALYGDFDAIDVVEKRGDVSRVKVAKQRETALEQKQEAALVEEAALVDEKIAQALPLDVSAAKPKKDNDE